MAITNQGDIHTGRCDLTNSVIGLVADVDIAGPVNCHSLRIKKLRHSTRVIEEPCNATTRQSRDNTPETALDIHTIGPKPRNQRSGYTAGNTRTAYSRATATRSTCVPLRAACAGGALSACCALRTCGARRSRNTLLTLTTLSSWRAARACYARSPACTCRTLRTGGTLCADCALRACCALSTLRACCALSTL